MARTAIDSSAGQDLVGFELAEDREDFKIAIGIALLVHGLIFAIRIPEIAGALATEDKQAIFMLTPRKFRPPETAAQEIPREPHRRVPIPDPTPAAPEPLVAAHLPAPVLDIPADVIVGDIPTPPIPRMEGPVLFRPEMNRPVRVAGADPLYTEIARRARVEGVVILQAVIDKSGSVRDIEILKPLRLGLDEAAVQAVETWQFQPATLDDRPIDVIYTLTVRFGLQ